MQLTYLSDKFFIFFSALGKFILYIKAFFVFYIGSNMTQACPKLQGVQVANADRVRIDNADKGAEISDGQ